MQSTELLRNTLNEWALLYNRRVTAEETEVWMKIFANTKVSILEKALQMVTHTAERMPAPGTLTKAIMSARDQNPHLLDTEHLIWRAGVDRDNVPCVFWSDEPNMPAYKAQDCPEGRTFLSFLRKRFGKVAQMVEREPGE